MIEMSEKNFDSWKTKLIILVIFIVVIILTAMVDWAAEHPEVGLAVRLYWLIFLLILGILVPIGFLFLAGNKIQERSNTDKKWFIIALILFLIANGIPIIFYVGIGIPPGLFLYVQLILFGMIPAFFLQPKSLKHQFLILIVLFTLVIVPIGILVNFTIDDIWIQQGLGVDPIDKTIYYMSFWGLLMTFFYLIIAIGWKLGGGSKRQSWNIFVAGTLLQFSTLEDFLYYFLNGQPLPGEWPWLRNFVINLEWLFGHVPTDLDLLIFCLITSLIALLILFDVHGYIWKKIKK